ncbi:MAG: FecR domain-containing protein, partial [Methylocystaceae bacterium]|nr:FecR domain-containing protein [Methylocystaceae bacterium]
MNYVDSGLGQSGGTGSADLVMSGDDAKVALPPSFNLATVQFDRQGPDLEITSADGKTILVTNYFSGGSSTKINLPNGVELPSHIVTKLAGPVASHNQLAQAVDAALSEPIGKVETASGQVFAVRADGTKVALKVGDNVFQGDELVTEGGASVGVVFADETTFALGEDGRMILDEMVYDPGAQDGAIGLTLLSGAMTFVSGAVAKVNPDAMEITTPVATIGIRGTAGILKVLNGQTDAALLPELAKGDVDPNQQGGDGTVIGEFDVI